MNIVRYFSPTGYRVALVATRGRKFITLIVIESDGLRLEKVALRNEKFITDAGRSTKVAWKRIARREHTTKGAKAALKLVLA